MHALPYCPSMEPVADEDGYTSKDGDRHSWENRIQLQKQSKKQSARHTGILLEEEWYAQLLTGHLTSHSS